MFKSQIQRIYHECESIKKLSDKNSFKEEFDEVIRCNNAMRKRIGGDKELEKLFDDFDRALNYLNCVEVEDIFKKGFILGARVALEICGVESIAD